MAEQIKVTLQQLRTKRDSILALAEQHNAYNVRVFGSVARGDNATTSDVDFLVSIHNNTSIFDLVALWLDLQDLLGCDADLSTDDSLRDHVRANALQDAIVL